VEAYEYIFAALVMVAVFTAAAYLAVTALPLYRAVSEVDQLKIVAQKVMNNILLNPGHPHDWGSDVSVRAEDLASFGLASYTTLTREAYVLDQDKVQRLSPEVGPLYVPPRVALDLLGLGLDYGIKLEFAPVLNVELKPSQGSEVVVKVTSEQGMPIEGASVTIVAIYVSDGVLSSSKSNGQTSVDGVCTLSLTSPLPALLITMVDYHGMKTVNVFTVGPGVQRSLVIGRSLIVDESIGLGDGLNGVTAYQFFVSSGPEGSLEVRNASCTLNYVTTLEGYNVYDMGFEERGLVAIVTLLGNGELLAAYKLVPESYSSIAGEVRPPISYTLERSVRIGLSHYNLRLTVWRMSW